MSPKNYCQRPGQNCSDCLLATSGPGRDCQGADLRYNLWQFHDESEGGACSLIGANVSLNQAKELEEKASQNFVNPDRLLLSEIG